MSAPEFPVAWEGRPLKSLPLSPMERTFAKDFPGHLGRFTDGSGEIIFRLVDRETRRLHPSADCMKASGYSIKPLPLLVDEEGRSWSRFQAEKGGERLLVREIIEDGQGLAWTDTSAWYWAAVMGRTQGPWRAVTIAEKAKESL